MKQTPEEERLVAILTAGRDETTLVRTIVYGQRHGEKDAAAPNGDGLTPFGTKQVRAGAEAHLPHRIDAAYCSDMVRALQTAEIAMAGRQKGVTTEPNFGYSWAFDKEHLPQCDLRAVERRLNEERGGGTVFDWLEAFPTALLFRERIGMMLKIVALRHGSATLYIASHSPVIEMAVPNTKGFPRLQEGDLIRYVLVGDGRDLPVIEFADYLRCPLVER